jgi:hypothetical protein
VLCGVRVGFCAEVNESLPVNSQQLARMIILLKSKGIPSSGPHPGKNGLCVHRTNWCDWPKKAASIRPRSNSDSSSPSLYNS